MFPQLTDQNAALKSSRRPKTHIAVVRWVSRSKTQILFPCFQCRSLWKGKLLVDSAVFFYPLLYFVPASRPRVICCWEYITGNFPDPSSKGLHQCRKLKASFASPCLTSTSGSSIRFDCSFCCFQDFLS